MSTCFVTYSGFVLDKLQRHRNLKQELSQAILDAMREDPDIQNRLKEATQEIFNELLNRQ